MSHLRIIFMSQPRHVSPANHIYNAHTEPKQFGVEAVWHPRSRASKAGHGHFWEHWGMHSVWMCIGTFESRASKAGNGHIWEHWGMRYVCMCICTCERNMISYLHIETHVWQFLGTCTCELICVCITCVRTYVHVWQIPQSFGKMVLHVCMYIYIRMFIHTPQHECIRIHR